MSRARQPKKLRLSKEQVCGIWFRGRAARMAGTVLLLVAVTMFGIEAKVASATLLSRIELDQTPVERLFTAPGRILTQGKNTSPTGELMVKTYRLEKVEMPDSMEFNDLRRLVGNRIIRLSVSLDGIINGPYVIWIGDDGFNAAHARDGELAAVLLGPAISLEDGATLAVARGINACNNRARSVLPEKLSVPEHLRRSWPEKEPATNFIHSLRSVNAAIAVRGAPDVEITLVTDVKWPVRNEVMVLQFGSQEFVRDPDNRGNVLVFRLTAKEFAAAMNGEMVKVKFGSCSFGGVRFGRLNKSLLDRG